MATVVDADEATDEVGADRPRRRDWWLPAGAGVLAAALFPLIKDGLTDDGYITLAYAKNLALHGEWGIVAGHPANSATSPLNVMLLGLVTWVTTWSGEAHPVFALGVVCVAATAALAWGWTRLIRALRLPVAAGVAGVALVVLNPLVLSAIGLEVLLIPALLILLAASAVEGRPVVFGVLCGLALLTRPDLVVFVVIIAVAGLRRGPLRALLAAVLVVAPWYLFSWFAFGSAVPDTLVIKQLQKTFGGAGYGEAGFDLAFGDDPMVVLTFAPALLGLLALFCWLVVRPFVRRPSARLGPVAALGVGGIAYYWIYSLLGVPPYHWYFVPPIVSLSMCAAGLAGGWFASFRERGRAWLAAPVAALGLLLLAVFGYTPAFAGRAVPWTSPPFFGNWASAADYARVGSELGPRLNGASVAAPGEIGTLAYFCDCTIVDGFSDRGMMVEQIDKRLADATPVTAWLLRLNYTHFDWSMLPVRPDLQLKYEKGPGSGPGTWTVYSEAKGVGHFSLTRYVEPVRSP